MKTRFLRLVALITLLCLLCGILPTPAMAWKTKTHNYSARLLVDELVSGYQTYGTYTVTYFDLLAESYPMRYIPVVEEFGRAITRYPQAFYAGSQGPDAYPDLYVGQTFIHPYDQEKDIGSEAWLEALVDAVNTMPQGDARDEAMAFVLGFMLHYCGDLFGHDYVNSYALGSFPEIGPSMSADDAKVIARHMAVESEMDKRIPQKYSDNDVHAPTEFLLNSLVYNGYADNGSAPIYNKDKYDKKPVHYKYLLDFRNALRGVAETLRKSPDPFSASLVLYLDRWIEDVDKGTKGLIETSDVVAQRLLLNTDPNVSDVDIFIEELTRWFTDWGRYITPIPDVAIKVHDISSQLIGILAKPFDFLKSPFTLFKDFIIKSAKNELIGKLDEMLGGHFTELIKKPTGVLFSPEALESYETDMFLFQHDAESSGNAAALQNLPAFYNTMMMMKLVLSGPEMYQTLLYGGKATSNYVMSRDCTATVNNLEVTISTAYANWAGTDDNIYLTTWGEDEQGRKYGEKKTLLDISAHNDFERGETDTYRVALGQDIPLEELHATISKDYIAVSDDWKLNAVEIMPCHGDIRMLQAGETYYNKADRWLKGRATLPLGRLFAFAENDPRFHYDSALNASSLSFIRSLDESQQWRNSANVMWNNEYARRNVFFRLFKGFAPQASFAFEADGKIVELSQSGSELVTIARGEDFRFSATRLENCWNGVPAARRTQWKDTKKLNSGMHYKPVTGDITFVLYNEAGEKADEFDSAIQNTNQPVQKTDEWADWQDSSDLKAGTYQVVAVYDGDANNAPFANEIAMLRVLPGAENNTVHVVNGTLDGTDAATGAYAPGVAVEIQADSREGWVFDRWESDDIDAWAEGYEPSDATAMFVMPDQPVTVTAMYKPEETDKFAVHVVNGTLAEINDTIGEYEADDTVTIQADSREGWVFDCWESECTLTWDSTQGANSSTAKFAMPDQPVTVTAVYRPVVHVVNGTLDGSATTGAYAAGESVTIRAHSREDWVFDCWESDVPLTWDNGQGKTGSIAKFLMPDQPVTVTAMYRPGQYAVTVKGGTGSGFYAPGDIVSISTKGSPEQPYFSKWHGASDDLDLLGNRQENMTVQFVMPQRDVQLEAVWMETTDEPDLITFYSTIVSVDGKEPTAPSYEVQPVRAGQEVVVRANTPPEGHRFVSWVMQENLMYLLQSNGESGDVLPAQLFNTEVTFTMPNVDVFLFAKYDLIEEEPKDWTVLVVGGSGAGNYLPGDTVEIEAYEPPEGEYFAGWERLIPSKSLDVDSSRWKNPRVSFRMPNVPDGPNQPGVLPEGDIETEDAYELFIMWLESQLDDNVMIFVAKYEPLPLTIGDHYSDPELPRTGDDSRLVLWAGLCAAALAGTLVLLVQRRRTKR